jgi:gamma-resorcylate decarboxylase
MATDPTDSITQRGFLGLTSATLVSTSLLRNANPAERETGLENTAVPDAFTSVSRIALEEHFAIPEIFDSSYAVKDLPSPEAKDRLLDVGAARVAMDRGASKSRFFRWWRREFRASQISSRPSIPRSEPMTTWPRTLPRIRNAWRHSQRCPCRIPQAAAQELTRCIRELGFAGTLVNGFSQIGEADSAVYYDLPQYRPFWATVQELDVPFYLHPRAPLPTRQQAYEGHAWLVGST